MPPSSLARLVRSSLAVGLATALAATPASAQGFAPTRPRLGGAGGGAGGAGGGG